MELLLRFNNNIIQTHRDTNSTFINLKNFLLDDSSSYNRHFFNNSDKQMNTCRLRTICCFNADANKL